MNVTNSMSSRGILGIMGHAGAGHVHSHSGFVQDDTAGFAVVACLFRRAYPVCTTISSVEADIDTGTLTVKTQDGGSGTAYARRGITPYEATLARSAIGLDAIYSQTAAFSAFGRIYGQGCMEPPVALQTACCLAVIDTFEKKYRKSFSICDEAMIGKVGKCIGSVIEIDGIPVSAIAVLNANEGGLGPDEDLEGNIMLGEKGTLMKGLGLDELPTIVIESKAYVPSVCKDLEENIFWIRMNRDVDNHGVYEALVKGAQAARCDYKKTDTAYVRGKGEIAAGTYELGMKIAKIGETLAHSDTAREKVRIIGELARLVSEDAGGISYMSSKMHDMAGGGGLMPGSSAVLSMAISESAIRIWKIPAFTAQDSDKYLAVLGSAIPVLAENIQAAKEELEAKRSFKEEEFAFLLK